MGRGHVVYKSWFRVKPRVSGNEQRCGKTAIYRDLLQTMLVAFDGRTVASESGDGSTPRRVSCVATTAECCAARDAMRTSCIEGRLENRRHGVARSRFAL
jgi:hypothetical protein